MGKRSRQQWRELRGHDWQNRRTFRAEVTGRIDRAIWALRESRLRRFGSHLWPHEDRRPEVSHG